MNYRHVRSGAIWLALAAVLAMGTGTAAEADGSQARFRLESPYAFGAYQHKVQLHAHTTHSDGDHAPEWLMQAYEKRGYAAVAITDHDYSRYSASLDDPGGHGIIHIPGTEYSGDDRERSWNHMLGINIHTIHHGAGTGARQAQIDQAHAEGGLAYLCHPYDETIHRRGWNAQDILELVRGFDGIEIHNGASYHDPGGRDYPYKVDMALSAGRRFHIIAVDDFHRNPAEALDRGHVVVNSGRDAASLRREDIIAALAAGNFYAAGRLNTAHPAPPRFTSITVDGHTITVETGQTTDIAFITARHNYCKDGPNWTQLNTGVTSASYTASIDDVYVRVQATYTEDGNESYAWSNPIYCTPE
jgi:hypothetical protein